MNSALTTQTEVLIVGAGPTGLTMACQLKRWGIPCRIIDQADKPSQTSKALGVHARTLERLEDMGIRQSLTEQGLTLRGGRFYAGKKQRIHLKFDSLSTTTPYPYVLSVPQSETEHELINFLHSLGGEVEYQKELLGLRQERDRVFAQVHHNADNIEEEIQARWLIGCDGAHSQVRKALQLKFSGSTYEERFFLADVKIDWQHKTDEPHIWLHEDGVLAVIPFPGQWRIVAAFPHSELEAMPEASLDQLQQIVQERTGDNTIHLKDSTWMSSFKIHRRLVERYRQGCVFLAGDSAHVHSPVGGQGMNLGIQDADNLAWKLALVIKRQSPPSLLDTYEVERRPIAKSVLLATDFATKMLTMRHPWGRFVRDRAILPLVNFNPLESLVLTRIAELNVSYCQSKLSQEYLNSVVKKLAATLNLEKLQNLPKAGNRAPLGNYLDPVSLTPKNILEILQGTNWTLLLFAGDEPSLESHTQLMSWVKSNLSNQVQVYRVIVNDKSPFEGNMQDDLLLDPTGKLHQLYGAKKIASLYLVRPDGYIGFRSQPPSLEPLRQYLKQHFNSAISNNAGIDFESKA